MLSSSRLKAYGENAGTFLIFQALAAHPGAIENVLLANLKLFGSGKHPQQILKLEFREAEAWLFPNFGKGRGFCEPDAVVLARDQTGGEHVFWIEVETTVNLQTGRQALRRSLLQLQRFRLFQYALNQGAKSVSGALRIIGSTIADKGVIREAQLLVRGHGVLMKIRSRLRRAGIGGRDHYVLFTVGKPKGVGHSGPFYGKNLKAEADVMTERYQDSPAQLPSERLWYCYWAGHLAGEFRDYTKAQFELDDYIRIKR